jgi:hypothetical protein
VNDYSITKPLLLRKGRFAWFFSVLGAMQALWVMPFETLIARMKVARDEWAKVA